MVVVVVMNLLKLLPAIPTVLGSGWVILEEEKKMDIFLLKAREE